MELAVGSWDAGLLGPELELSTTFAQTKSKGRPTNNWTDSGGAVRSDLINCFDFGAAPRLNFLKCTRSTIKGEEPLVHFLIKILFLSFVYFESSFLLLSSSSCSCISFRYIFPSELSFWLCEFLRHFFSWFPGPRASWSELCISGTSITNFKCNSVLLWPCAFFNFRRSFFWQPGHKIGNFEVEKREMFW